MAQLPRSLRMGRHDPSERSTVALHSAGFWPFAPNITVKYAGNQERFQVQRMTKAGTHRVTLDSCQVGTE